MMQPAFNFSQALQLVGLAPALLLIVYLLMVARDWRHVLVPLCFFLLMTLQFVDAMLPAIYPLNYSSWTKGFFFLVHNTVPAFGYLLIMQCVLNRIPPFTFWLVLAVPFVAAPPYMYAALSTGELCFSIVDCFNAESAMILNRTGMNLLVFLLLTFCAVRTFPTLPGDDVVRHHRYFLILTLICLHVVLLGLDISLVGKYVSDEQHLFLATLVKLCFLYFVMISVFRFFSEAFTVPETKMVSEEPELSEKEKQIALQLVDLLNKEKIYCDLHISRDRLAEKLNIKTYQLSHIINRHFEKSYTDLISDHRVDDAKQRLMSSSEPITAIAYDVGFGSIASFNRVFKERCGMSPSAYRTKNRKNIVFS